MWKPKYQITNKNLHTVRQIGEVLGEIKYSHISSGSLATLEYRARELSTFASTSIEGNPLALTDVKRLLKTKPSRLRDTEREIVNYNKALQYVYTKIKDGNFTISVKEIEKIQSIVVDGLMDNKSDIGKLRKKPVVIRDPRRKDTVIFIPPDSKDIKKLIEELCNFINQNQNEIEPIILAGLFHRQAVIIHPFMDGNGRTTRILTTAILGSSGIDIFDIFSFENYYNQNVSRYFKQVGLEGDYYDHKNTDFTSWLEYFSEGILDELKRVQKTIPVLNETRIPDHYQVVMDYIEKHGSISQKQYGEISSRSLSARKKDFVHMQELGMIKSIKGGRSTYYRYSETK